MILNEIRLLHFLQLFSVFGENQAKMKESYLIQNCLQPLIVDVFWISQSLVIEETSEHISRGSIRKSFQEKMLHLKFH